MSQSDKIQICKKCILPSTKPDIQFNEAKVKAIASASIYHFTEITPLEVKKYIQKKGFKTRI